MFNKKTVNKENEVDIKKLNDVIGMTRKILSITYVFIVILGIYAATMVFKEWQVGVFLLNLLKIVSPLFIGFVIAWLLEPIVRFLKNHKIPRGIATALVYVALIAIVVIILSALIPVLSEQINEIVRSIPTISDTVQKWLNDILNSIDNIDGIDITSIKNDLFVKLEEIGTNLTSSLPSLTVKVVSSTFSGLGSLVVGFFIGFYLLMSFENFNDAIISFIPKKNRDDFRGLTNEVNTSLRKYVQGTLICASLIFLLSSIGFGIAGLKAPILFGLFCGITNIIPYVGPYIGGAPAVLVGFSQGPIVGIISLVTIVIAQFLEGNILNPIVMSKTMKLHPVTIILGLLIFGHFWGILGMLLATPTIAVLKSIILFLDDKYDILSFN